MGKLVGNMEEALRASGRRVTPQRRLILKALAEGGEHLDAAALYDRVRARDSSVSLATVYRTLGVLKGMGLVEEHHLGSDQGHYEAVDGGPHYHFSCLRCGKVIEFTTPWVERIVRDLRERRGIDVVSTHLHISGYCASCADAPGPASDSP
ncbi:MAG: Fur family transcriptional regulator [Anaerolineae bacterium]